MTVKSLMKSSGAYTSLAALAVGIAAMALPASASAQDSRWGNRSADSQSERSRPPTRREAWSTMRQRSSEQAAPRRNRSESQANSGQSIRRIDPSTDQAPRVQRSQNDGNPVIRQQRREQRPEVFGNTQQRSQQQVEQTQRRWNNQADRNQRVDNDRNRGERTWTQRDTSRRWDGDRNRRVDNDPNRVDRNWRNRDNDRRWDGDRNRRVDRDQRYRNRDQRYAWNNTWRRDNRYNWYNYRNYNRNVFRLGTYYSPYRNWSYRRLSIGFFLEPLFYSSNYWLDDPWMYRLPPAYGPYRWVRYYDDALLVDIYTGEVIDVIYDFFW